jgi:hypothetical protein
MYLHIYLFVFFLNNKMHCITSTMFAARLNLPSHHLHEL